MVLYHNIVSMRSGKKMFYMFQDGIDNMDASFYSEPRGYITEADYALLHSWNTPMVPDSTSSFRINSTDARVPDPGNNEEASAWKNKPIKDWMEKDVLHWISFEALALDICCTELSGMNFKDLTGQKLLLLTKAQFIEYDRKYGAILYKKLQELIEKEKEQEYALIPMETGNEAPSFTSLDEPRQPQKPVSPEPQDSEKSDSSRGSPEPIKPRKPGRPKTNKRKKKPERLGRLWEFLRDLLKNPDYCPRCIMWDDHDEGTFRFVRSDEVAKLWGKKKDNSAMNYEKLSRAMRYYYKSQVLLPVLGRRLVYKFGPNAQDWRVKNPNFQN